MSYSLRSHGLQYARPPRPSPASIPEFTQTHIQRVGGAIQPSHPLSSPSPPAINLSQLQGLLKWVSSSHQVTKVLEFQLHHQSFNECLGLISFRVDWLDLLEIQGTLKSLLQYHSSNASIFQCSAFFIVQLSHPYMTTGKTVALTRQTFVGKVTSLLFNMLLEKEMATHSNTLSWKIPWMEEPDRLQSMGLQRVGHNWVIFLSFFSF